MTVKELIKTLKNFPDNTPVIVDKNRYVTTFRPAYPDVVFVRLDGDEYFEDDNGQEAIQL